MSLRLIQTCFKDVSQWKTSFKPHWSEIKPVLAEIIKPVWLEVKPVTQVLNQFHICMKDGGINWERSSVR